MLRLLKTFFKDDLFVFPDFSIICLTGLTIVTVIAGILSLFIPLGGWQVQMAARNDYPMYTIGDIDALR